MQSCLFASTLPFTCDIWVQEETQDSDSGEIVKTWKFNKNVKAGIRKASGIGKKGNSYEEMGRRYEYWQLFYLVVMEDLPRTIRVVNIKDREGNQIYTEENGDSTIFEALGQEIDVDSVFGTKLGYKMMLNRAEVQKLG